MPKAPDLSRVQFRTRPRLLQQQEKQPQDNRSFFSLLSDLKTTATSITPTRLDTRFDNRRYPSPSCNGCIPSNLVSSAYRDRISKLHNLSANASKCHGPRSNDIFRISSKNTWIGFISIIAKCDRSAVGIRRGYSCRKHGASRNYFCTCLLSIDTSRFKHELESERSTA